MKADEMISHAEVFVMGFVTKIKDTNTQEAAKMTYFMDNQERLQKVMEGLRTVISELGNEEDNTGDNATLIDRAKELLATLQSAISDFQKTLKVNPNVTDDDTTATLTHETLSDALKTNTTTQEIQQNMTEIKKQQKAAAVAAKATTEVEYNYCLIVDGQLNMFAANTKDEINANINQVMNCLKAPAKSINLYAMTFTPIKLQKKTILSI